MVHGECTILILYWNLHQHLIRCHGNLSHRCCYWRNDRCQYFLLDTFLDVLDAAL